MWLMFGLGFTLGVLTILAWGLLTVAKQADRWIEEQFEERGSDDE